MQHSRKRLAVSLACLAWGATDAMAGTVAFTPAGDIFSATSPPVNLGAVFTPTAAISVDALGFYDGVGITAAETVGLYDASGSLLASVSVPDTGPTVGGFFFAAITPVALTAGAHYTVVALTGSNAWSFAGANPGTASDITYLDHKYAYSGSLTFPTGAVSGGAGAYYGPNFEYTTTAPEPATWAMMALGFLGLGLAGRRSARSAGSIAA